MIFYALLLFFKFLLQGLLLLLPSGTEIPTQVGYYFALFWQPIKNLNILFPISETIIYILPAWLILHLGVMTFYLVNWIIKKIRGSG